MIKDMAEADQPLYRVNRVGTAALSNAELIQLIGRFTHANTATDIMTEGGSLLNLAKMSTEELSSTPGVGPAIAASIKAAFELGQRLAAESSPERTQVMAPIHAAAPLMLRYGQSDQEHMVVLLLDTKNRIIGEEVVYKGSLSTCVIRVGELFKTAIKRNAAAIILSHNHPSGDPSPSPEDIIITRSTVQAGELLDIEVLDHIIVTRDNFISMKERGLGF